MRKLFSLFVFVLLAMVVSTMSSCKRSGNRFQVVELSDSTQIDTTSVYDEEYGDYFSQFRVKDKNGKSIPVGDLWKTLTFAERRRIEEAAKHITTDDAGEQIIYDPSARNGNGGGSSPSAPSCRASTKRSA